MRKLIEIILHCSATPEGRHVTVETIRGWHKAKGWKDIGYHFVIYLDGTIHAGRPIEQIGAHVAGRNAGTIGICYIGGVAKDGRTPKDTRTEAQKLAIIKLTKELKEKYYTIEQFSGHNQYAAKACPSFDASTYYDQFVGGRHLGHVAKKPAVVDKRYRWLQKLLAASGRTDYFGLADGIKGPKTIKAIKQYQTYTGLPVTGEFDTATVAALREIEKENAPKAKTPVKTMAVTGTTGVAVVAITFWDKILAFFGV